MLLRPCFIAHLRQFLRMRNRMNPRLRRGIEQGQESRIDRRAQIQIDVRLIFPASISVVSASTFSLLAISSESP